MKPCVADIGGLRTGGISTLQPKQNADAALEMSLDEAVHSRSVEILAAAAANPAISEDLALGLLKRSDLPVQAIDHLSKNGSFYVDGRSYNGNGVKADQSAPVKKKRRMSAAGRAKIAAVAFPTRMGQTPIGYGWF